MLTVSLTRGWVYRLQLLLVLARAVILGSESRGNHDHILSQIPDSPNLEDQVPAFTSPRNRVARLYLQALGSFSVAPTSRRATVEVFDPSTTRGVVRQKADNFINEVYGCDHFNQLV
jgi:hypothetical protein